MRLKDLTFRDIDQHCFLLENEKDRKKIRKKLIDKNYQSPILVIGYINHDKGLLLRVLGPIIYHNNDLSIENNYIENKIFIDYDTCEDFIISKVPKDVFKKIDGIDRVFIQTREDDINIDILKTRDDTFLDEYRDIRLIDDIQFLLINKVAKQENVWGRIEGKSKDGFIICSILDKPDKKFNLKKGEHIEIKYIDHPKYKGLVFVKKIEHQKTTNS